MYEHTRRNTDRPTWPKAGTMSRKGKHIWGGKELAFSCITFWIIWYINHAKVLLFRTYMENTHTHKCICRKYICIFIFIDTYVHTRMCLHTQVCWWGSPVQWLGAPAWAQVPPDTGCSPAPCLSFLISAVPILEGHCEYRSHAPLDKVRL